MKKPIGVDLINLVIVGVAAGLTYSVATNYFYLTNVQAFALCFLIGLFGTEAMNRWVWDE